MQKEERSILEDYYLEIEKTSELNAHICPSSKENATEADMFRFRIEYWAQTALVENSVVEMFSDKKDEVKEYLTERITNTSNFIMKAKYNNFAFVLTKNNKYCQEAIEYYQRALTSAFQNTNKEHYELQVDEVFEKVLKLSLSIKYQLPELKKQIAEYLLDETISDRLKTRLFMSVREQILFSVKESESIYSCFIKIAKSTRETIWVEHNLNLALFFASKTQDQQQIRIIYELLGDNECNKIYPDDENNLAIPHLNETIYEEAINYYQKAKCEQKLKMIWDMHQKNKTKKQYIPIRIKSEISQEVITALNQHLEYISNLPPRIIVANLVLCRHFLFISNDKLKEATSNSELYFHEQFFTPVQVDINANHKKSQSEDNNKFQYYNLMMQRNVDFILRSIAGCIQKHKLSYRKLHSTLGKHTSFGTEQTRNIGNSSLTYTWLSMVDVGLENFFKEFTLLMKGKVPDWRLCIDVLSTKFEGILREMLAINGASITKLKDGNTSFITLEQMIRLESEDIKDAFHKSFDDDDLNLFQYVFSSIAQCHNIRNNVAHCYYLPQMYTLQMALLVMLGVLRLAKFVPSNDVNS